MHKWIGSIFIVFACSGMGICFSQELHWHLQELEQVKQLFYLLRSEMQYTRAPFDEMFEKIGKKTSGQYGKWLLQLCQSLREKGAGSFWKLWCTSIDLELQNSKLTKGEKEELKNVGKNLDYIESLDLYIEQLEYTISRTRENNQSKTKLCQSMGIMGGIFLVILLL